MSIDTNLNILSTFSLPALTRPGQQSESRLFGAVLTGQMSQSTGDNLEDYLEELKKNGFTGFFKKIEEDKLEKIREKILKEMGLTEADLADLSPQRRAAIEKVISQEIQRRMAMGSMDKDKGNTGQIYGGADTVQMITGTGTPEEILPAFLNSLFMEMPEQKK